MGLIVLLCFSKCEKVPILNRGSRTPREPPAKSYRNIFQFMVDPRPPATLPRKCFFEKTL
eukprot:UN00213